METFKLKYDELYHCYIEPISHFMREEDKKRLTLGFLKLYFAAKMEGFEEGKNAEKARTMKFINATLKYKEDEKNKDVSDLQ